MEALLDLLKKTKSLDNADVWEKVFKEDNIQNYVIVELIQEEQLYGQGIDDTGNPIKDRFTGSTTYSALTEILSNGRKKEGTHYTLLDTGEFYKSMIINVFKNYIEISADPIKNDNDLFTKYGEGIIGLTEESKNKLAQKIAPRYQFYILQYLQRDR